MKRKPMLIAGMMCLLAIPCSLPAQNQGPPASEAELEEAYEWRVRQEVLYGVYIPADLGEAFVQLNRLSSAEDRAAFKQLSEEEAMTVPFFGLGRWISYNWGFYGGSRFAAYLKQLGLHHPEDMTRFTLLMYHRHLHERPLEPKPVVEALLEKRAAAEQNRKLEGEVLFEETRRRPRPQEKGG